MGTQHGRVGPSPFGSTEPNDVGDLTHQVRAEFLEMPGLTLTLRQAMRLWNLDARLCHAVLEPLVANGFLARTRHGAFRRAEG